MSLRILKMNQDMAELNDMNEIGEFCIQNRRQSPPRLISSFAGPFEQHTNLDD
jgi:hypothetical protein